MKKLERGKTFEETYTNYYRYIDVVAGKMGHEHFDDLKQMGYIGLFKAYEKYDESQGTFHKLAIVAIRHEMITFLNNHSNTIRIGKVGKEKGYETIPTISTSTQLDENYTIEDTIECDYDTNNYDNSNDVIRDVLRHYQSQLKAKYQTILKMYYEEDMTFADIGKELELTREAVRQQHDKAIKKLQELMIKK